MQLVLGSGIVCVSSWLALAIGAGWVGLSRSVSIGATTLVEHPTALALVVIVATATGFSVTRAFTLRPFQLLVGVLVGDAFAGLVLAPIAIGELEPIHAPIVFLAVSVLGLQPVAAVIGSWVATIRRRPPVEEATGR